MSNIQPLAPHTISLILQYIAPPSQLTQSLPPHLLSSALSQRHHFLSITPDQPKEYLCWPASGGAAIDVLENLPKPADDDPSALASVPIKYTADDEHVYAHATLTIPDARFVRLVFQWDGTDAWRYHDASTSPVQQESADTPSAALQSLSSKSVLAAAAPHSHTPEETHHRSSYGADASFEEDTGDYDYWNSYGGAEGDDDEHGRRLSSSHKPSAADKGEDAYWAQYGSVHGTADSTIPSPAPEKAGKRPFWARGRSGLSSGRVSRGHSSLAPSRPPEELEDYDFQTAHANTNAIRIPNDSSFVRRPPPLAKDGSPPCADTLRELLETVPPRENAWKEEDVHHESPRLNGVAEATVPRAALGLTTNGLTNGVHTSKSDTLASAQSPADGGLKETIAGLYTLWKTTRPEGVGKDSSAFLEFVKQAVV